MQPAQALKRLSGWQKRRTRPGTLADCALIVPTFRRPKEMVRLLGALTGLADTPGEVLVVDGSPGAEVKDAIETWADGRQLPFDLIWVKSPPGLTRQRNVGIDACDREFIFFLDDDCLPEPGYFQAIRRVFIDDSAKTIGAVRGFLTNGINQPLTRLLRLRLALGLLPRSEPGLYHACGSSGTWNMVPRFQGTRTVEVLAGGASAYRREVFEKHRFSEFFHGYAQGEDLEMSRRVAKDWRLVVCGDALVNHDHAESGRPAGFARGRMAVRNRYFIWKRHSPGAGLRDRIRFWADHALVVLYNLAGWLRHPGRVYPLAYATGTFWGALECVVFPPRFQEPPARREYEFCRG